MARTIELSDKSAALLTRHAAAHGKSLQAWLEDLAIEKTQSDPRPKRGKARAAAQGILALQGQVKPDPEGWTVRQYIDHGRR
jgi:hypothetical protein